MTLFDAPNRELCTASRETTITPLQALVLLNDPQFVEAARVTAESLLKARDSADPSAMLRAGFMRLIGREPATAEIAALEQLHGAQLRHFSENPEAASGLLTVGEKPVDAALTPAEVAALTTVVQALMSHYEFVTKI